ncbi:hypothetical protein ACJRPK_15325 [Aquimarina sp. 2-A2]|uniref:hypothetical protein n=1 Tax=Aquimarina sp. 2-A2 TaxID=3382644 RepID=UPI00387F2DD0
MKLSPYKTLLEDIQTAKNQGFTVDFLFKDDMIYNRESGKGYSKHDCLLVSYSRHEGLSDPSDASILFLIACNDGLKGCLSSNYGIHADMELMQFALSLESYSEQNKSKNAR